MMATLSQKRLEILKHLHRHQEENVAALWTLPPADKIKQP
jgi:hypothetical protein